MHYSPFLSCRQASQLITARLDRPLSTVERIALGLHLRICSACPIVVRQLDVIRESVHALRETTEATAE